MFGWCDGKESGTLGWCIGGNVRRRTSWKLSRKKCENSSRVASRRLCGYKWWNVSWNFARWNGRNICGTLSWKNSWNVRRIIGRFESWQKGGSWCGRTCWVIDWQNGRRQYGSNRRIWNRVKGWTIDGKFCSYRLSNRIFDVITEVSVECGIR